MRTPRFPSSRIARIACLMLCLAILLCGDLLTATESAGVETKDLLKSSSVAPVVSPPSGPEVVGQWSGVIPVPIVPIHMILLPNGKVFLFQDDDHPNYNADSSRLAGYTVAYVWDVNSGVFTQADNTTKNEFCAGHSFLPDGRLLIVGGHDGQDDFGTRDAFIFDSSNNTWIQTNQPMAQGRWYPSNVTLGNGEVVVVAGNANGSANNTPEVWETNSGGGWRLLSSATLSVDLYPYMHLAPNGKVFIAGPGASTHYLDPVGTGAVSTVGPRVGGDRDYGSSVMYDVGKVVIIGGGDPPVSSAEVIDLNQASPAWSSVGSMAHARRQMNATLLPDGKILVTGGSSFAGWSDPAGAVLAAEMWNPATGNFTTMASMAKARLYHSSTILLPDARVLSAGNGRPGIEERNAEIFSPPYLFTTGGVAAVRPTIDSHLSKGVRPGQTIFVTTPDAASITSVTLVAPSSVTHSRNMSQRFNRLTFTQGVGGLNVTLPADANACPPGPYMLFIVNSSGVPSVAQFVNVNSSDPLPPSTPSNLVATATSTSSVSLSWSAASGSVDHYEIQRSVSRNGPFTSLAPTTATAISDGGLSSGTTYIYRVRAVDAQGNYSDLSNIDIATTINFADDPLVIGVTVGKAQHLTELRQAVDAVRAAAALGGAGWTEIAPLGVIIKAVHITELRSNLDQARSLLGLSTGSYTDSIMPGVTVVKAIHITELRGRVK